MASCADSPSCRSRSVANSATVCSVFALIDRGLEIVAHLSIALRGPLRASRGPTHRLTDRLGLLIVHRQRKPKRATLSRVVQRRDRLLPEARLAGAAASRVTRMDAGDFWLGAQASIDSYVWRESKPGCGIDRRRRWPKSLGPLTCSCRCCSKESNAV